MDLYNLVRCLQPVAAVDFVRRRLRSYVWGRRIGFRPLLAANLLKGQRKWPEPF